jgi:hypothetical protein
MGNIAGDLPLLGSGMGGEWYKEASTGSIIVQAYWTNLIILWMEQ